MKTLTPKVIGYETIYPLQQRIAQRTMNMLLENEKKVTRCKRSPVILLQPQMGKTGCVIELIYLFITDCIARKRKFQIMVVCGLSQKDLAAQTRSRLTEDMLLDGITAIGAQLDRMAKDSGLLALVGELWKEGVVIRHNSKSLKKLDLKTSVDVRLWITDEVHLGNGKKGILDTMLRNHGVRLNEQIHRWDNSETINHFVGVSATPSAHMAHSDNIDLEGDSLFHWIYEAPSSEYNSMGIMLERGRFFQTEPMTYKGAPTLFLKRVLADFAAACKTHGLGHLVVRAVGDKHAALMAFINRRGSQFECMTFDSDRGNIDDLNRFLCTKPAQPMIVVIKGSMRAGITLGHNHFIRGWVETESTNSDSQAQSGVGRACGYGRVNDIYPIYCDLHHVKMWVDAYDALNKKEDPTIPKGLHNYGGKKGIRSFPWTVFEGTFKEALALYVKPFAQADKRDASGAKIGGVGAVRRQISKCSEQVYLDIADLAMKMMRRSSGTVGYYIDGPTSKKAVQDYLASPTRKHTDAQVWAMYKQNLASYAKLIKLYPQAKGKVLILDVGPNNKGVLAKESRTRDDFQKKGSALKA